MNDPIRQKWIDAGLEDSYNELLNRDGIKQSGFSEQQLREQIEKLASDWFGDAIYREVLRNEPDAFDTLYPLDNKAMAQSHIKDFAEDVLGLVGLSKESE